MEEVRRLEELAKERERRRQNGGGDPNDPDGDPNDPDGDPNDPDGDPNDEIVNPYNDNQNRNVNPNENPFIEILKESAGRIANQYAY